MEVSELSSGMDGNKVADCAWERSSQIEKTKSLSLAESREVIEVFF